MNMTWEGKELRSIGGLIDAMAQIQQAEDREQQAQQFMTLYRAVSKHADENIGYLCGYFGNRLELQRLFGVTHPVLGDVERTQEEAFEMGKKLGESWARKT